MREAVTGEGGRLANMGIEGNTIIALSGCLPKSVCGLGVITWLNSTTTTIYGYSSVRT